jgi:hypothetical protein
MQTLMFSGMSLDAVSDSAQYTWDDFTVRFKQVAAMGQLQTDLQVYDEISNVRCNMYERCNTPAILHRIESLWPKMLVQPADGTKIYQIWRALHPELRMQMAIDPSNQQQWSTYSTFRQHLVSKAPHFDATVIPARAAALLPLLKARSPTPALPASLMAAVCCAEALAALRSKDRRRWPRAMMALSTVI